ncbi:MAG: DNA polymerase III subunit beta [Candidatus Delongbacteria bacterium]
MTMRFTVPQKEFLAQLQKLSAVVPSKTTHPMLNNILLHVEPDEARMTATDLEISLTTRMKVEGGQGEDVAIPCKRLLEIVRELDERPVTVQTDRHNNGVEILSGQGVFQIPCESAENFPILPGIQVSAELEIPAERLRQHVERLAFAVSTDDLRPVLTGVLFEFRAEALFLVATDGHRLVRIQDHKLAGQESLGSVVIPIKALNLVARSLDSSSENVKLSLAQNHLVFSLGGAQIYTQLINGRYPAYEGVIPLQNENILQTARGALYRAVKQVSNCANNVTRQINFTLSENRLVVTAEDNEYGSRGRNELDVDYNGDALEIAFNASYLDQMLRHLDTDQVVFKFGTAERAALILPEINQEDEDLLMLLMPVRLMR